MDVVKILFICQILTMLFSIIPEHFEWKLNSQIQTFILGFNFGLSAAAITVLLLRHFGGK